ncbi:MAG: hypothetical protein IT210_03575 [Armatimonadetes bacterium]|nr:hypothetical protein [Armatimonadota bacterium]
MTILVVAQAHSIMTAQAVSQVAAPTTNVITVFAPAISVKEHMIAVTNTVEPFRQATVKGLGVLAFIVMIGIVIRVIVLTLSRYVEGSIALINMNVTYLGNIALLPANRE